MRWLPAPCGASALTRPWSAGGIFGFGAYVVPSLHLAAWNFTGGAKG